MGHTTEAFFDRLEKESGHGAGLPNWWVILLGVHYSIMTISAAQAWRIILGGDLPNFFCDTVANIYANFSSIVEHTHPMGQSKKATANRRFFSVT